MNDGASAWISEQVNEWTSGRKWITAQTRTRTQFHKRHIIHILSTTYCMHQWRIKQTTHTDFNTFLICPTGSTWVSDIGNDTYGRHLCTRLELQRFCWCVISSQCCIFVYDFNMYWRNSVASLCLSFVLGGLSWDRLHFKLRHCRVKAKNDGHPRLCHNVWKAEGGFGRRCAEGQHSHCARYRSRAADRQMLQGGHPRGMGAL